MVSRHGKRRKGKMGLLDKLKSVGKILSGGGAQVHLEIGEASLHEPFPVKVKALISDDELKINGVYLLVRAEEEVRLDGDRVERTIRERIEDFAADGRLDDIVDRVTTCDFRVNVAGPATLEANGDYEWDAEVTLPPGSTPSFRGRNCAHVWQIQAGLDAFGNDPDSGWVEFHVPLNG
jgi:hypothetical protein